MNIANEITDRVNMTDVFERYGFKVDRNGFIVCPFHSEKTASLGSYADNKRFKCFGCGVGGSVIDFVMLLFGISFRVAIVRINYDFNLDLPIGVKISINERRRLAEKQAERKKKYEDDKRAEEEKEALYWKIFDKYRACEVAIEKYAPKTENEKWSEDFCNSIRLMPFYEYLLDLTERRRFFG